MNLIVEIFLSWLSKPNFILILIFSISIFVILSNIHIELLSTLYNIKFSKKEKMIFISVFSILNTINNIFVINGLYKLISLCLLSVCIFMFLKVSYKKTLFFTCMSGTIILMLDVFVLKLFNYIPKDLESLINLLVIGMVILVESSFIYFLKKKSIFFLEKAKKKEIKSGIVMAIFIVFLLFKNYKYNIAIFEVSNFIIIIDIFSVVIFLNFALISTCIHLENRLESQKKELLKKYTRPLSTENVKKFKKDFIAIMQDIGGYIKYDDFESLKFFYNEIMQEYRDINKLALLNPEIVNESAIYNILCNKYYLARQSEIEVELEILIDFKKINIKAYELARILGIFLDNAIESSKNCKEKYIYISFRSGMFKDTIKIANTYDNREFLDLNKIFNKGYSTKNKNTGLGLWEVKQILLKHSNLDLYTHRENEVFCQELSIYHN